MREPSTAWKEDVQIGEAQRFAEAARLVQRLQADRNAKLGKGRALHRKQIVALDATLTIEAGLPAHAAHGLFAAPGRRAAKLRLSNGGMDVARDKVPDIRGFSIKVLGVDGESALGGRATSQDFLLINREVFGFRRPEAFFALLEALPRGPLAILGLMIRTHGFLGGLKQVGALQKGQKRPFDGFARERFFSAAPIACGPYAARVRLSPVDPPAAVAGPDFVAQVSAQLKQRALAYALELQFFVDEQRTPIEDGSVDWQEAEAPYLVVGRLDVPQQDPASEAGKALAEEVEAMKLDPWGGLAAHRPLGAIMRARKDTYFASQQGRGAS